MVIRIIMLRFYVNTAMRWTKKGMHNCHATEAKAGEKRLTELMSYRINMQRTSANTRSMSGVGIRIPRWSRDQDCQLGPVLPCHLAALVPQRRLCLNSKKLGLRVHPRTLCLQCLDTRRPSASFHCGDNKKTTWSGTSIR